MKRVPHFLLQLTMALGLSLALVVPMSALTVEVPAQVSECDSCTSCCPSEEENAPCEPFECDCPDCPCGVIAKAPLTAVIFRPMPIAASAVPSLLVPDLMGKIELVNIRPPVPPPRVG
ncbi:hypothetical protein OAG80_02560 [Akkermansiaceae bacterium]|nr:hypothetical protein [Akkermansiaceae bacterium]